MKNNIKSKKVINIVLLITVFILFFLGTYNSSFATKEDDKIWNVKITNENNDLTLEKVQNIKFITKENKNIAPGKLAPGTTATATIDLDLTGAKTAVDLDIELDETQIISNQFKTKVFLDGREINYKETQLIELENNIAFTEKNGKKEIKIELQWEDNENNIEDTLVGMNVSNITIPIKITISQHIK